MKELAVASFFLNFKAYSVHVMGFMVFALLIYWVFMLWDTIIASLTASREEITWFIACVLFGCFVFAVFLVNWDSEFFLIALSLGLGLGLAMFDATAAACLFVSLMFLRPWELILEDDYFLILPKLTYGICAGHVLLRVAKEGINWTLVSTFLFALAVWAYLTTTRAPDLYRAQVEYFESLFKGAFLYYMVTNVLSTPRQLKTFSGTLILIFLFLGLLTIYQMLGIPEVFRDETNRLRGIGAYGNSNDIAALMVLIFPFFLLGAFRKSSTPFFRILSRVSVPVVLYVIYLSQSRGAWLGIGVIIMTFTVVRIYSRVRSRRHRRAWVGGVIGATLLAVALVISMSGRTSDDLEESSQNRRVYMEAGFWMGVKNPIFGVGFGAYPANLASYARGPLNEKQEMTAHSSWVLIFAECGPLGLLLFLMIYFGSMRLAWRIFDPMPELFLSLAGYGVVITFLSHTYLMYPYLLFGLVGVAHHIFERHKFPVKESLPQLAVPTVS